MSQPGYAKQAQSLLEKFNGVCQELTSFAAANKLHPAHVKHMQDQIGNRTKILVKQLAVEHVDLETELPTIDEKK